MKKLFFRMAIAAVMIVAGTNVYLANKTDETASSLKLEYIDAEGWPVAESIINAIFSYGSNEASSDCNPRGEIQTRRTTKPNNPRVGGTEIFCVSNYYAYDCNPTTFRFRTAWDDGTTTYK